ncbi:MAG TPA: DUF3618 domain-containing protein [Beijerinckiaceae bacterium]|jgi:hypothetical protein
MTQSITDLEQDIETTRARLDDTITRLQGRLSVSGVLDDMLGASRRTNSLNAVYDHALNVVRRNPVPVALVAVGIGLLLHRMAQSERSVASRRVRVASEPPVVADDVPVLNTGAARVYDPDVSPRHPTQDSLESRRSLSARA